MTSSDPGKPTLYTHHLSIAFGAWIAKRQSYLVTCFQSGKEGSSFSWSVLFRWRLFLAFSALHIVRAGIAHRQAHVASQHGLGTSFVGKDGK